MPRRRLPLPGRFRSRLELALVGLVLLSLLLVGLLHLWLAEAGRGEVVLALLAVTGALVALAYGLAALLAGPVERLAEAAEPQDDCILPRPLPTDGPEELAAVAAAVTRDRAAVTRLLEERTQLLAAISHDMRAPATRMRLRAEFVRDGAVRDKLLADLEEMEAMLAASLDFLVDDAAREPVELLAFTALLQSLCEDYADMGRPVSFDGPPPLSFDPVGTVFGSGGGGRLTFGPPPQIRLRGRPRSLRRAFANLIENALTYGGRARVSLSADTAEAVVEVLDDGPGIPEAEMDKVLRPFYRLDPSRNRSTGGAGLGLSIVKSVVDAHQGRLELVNRLEGGLRVRVTLPRVL